MERYKKFAILVYVMVLETAQSASFAPEGRKFRKLAQAAAPSYAGVTNGNFTANTTYQGEFLNRTSTVSSQDCFGLCKAFNSVRGEFCNVYSWCGYTSCKDQFENPFSFGECLIGVQDGLTQVDQKPVTYPLMAGQTPGTLGSGSFVNETVVAALVTIGNFTYNRNYTANLISSTLATSPLDCSEKCRLYRGTGGSICNVFTYCASLNNCYDGIIGTPSILFGQCLLKYRSDLNASLSTLADRNTSDFVRTTNLGSGVYLGPHPDLSTSSGASPGAIAGGVVGGVVGVAILAAAVAVACRRSRRRRASRTDHLAGRNRIAHQYFSTEEDVPEFADISELLGKQPCSSTEVSSGSLTVPELNGDSDERTTVMRVKVVDGPDTLAFQGEEAGGMTAVKAAGDDRSLQETWMIDPSSLQIRKKADGQLFRLGAGGSGQVYLGIWQGSTNVAIKVVDSPTPAQQRQFVREIMLLRACHHPNIIQFLGASIQPDNTILVMEVMPGGDLYSQIRDDEKGFFRWKQQGRSIALDVAKGLMYLHSHSLLHLDIKSPNILLGREGGAKISDVGLAQSIGKGDATTRAYGASFPWCAPEQLNGDPCSPATDIFGFASVLHEIIIGDSPDRSRRFRAIKVPEEAPQEVSDLFRRCHETDPTARPTAAEAHAILMAHK